MNIKTLKIEFINYLSTRIPAFQMPADKYFMRFNTAMKSYLKNKGFSQIKNILEIQDIHTLREIYNSFGNNYVYVGYERGNKKDGLMYYILFLEQRENCKKQKVGSELDGFVYEEDDINDQRIEEGRLITTHYGRYERSQKAKKICLEHYGYVCHLCGINYCHKYGDQIGKSVIEVHHIDPIHGFHGKSHTIDPIKDLIPVCSNCHSILHSKSKDIPYTLDEAKKLLKITELQ